MFRLTAILALVSGAAAFAPASINTVKSASLKMSAEGLAGAVAPTGFFDPAGFSAGKTDAEIKKIREAELKHGRLAMLATVGVLVGEKFNPLFDGKVTGPAIFQFQQCDAIFPAFWTFVLLGVGFVEGQNILTGWEQKPGSDGISNLKDEYVNGDLGFDPLGLKPADEEAFDIMRTKELQNGRLAMIGIAGMVAQELVNDKGIFETLGL